MGEKQKGMEELVKYLEFFMSDIESWQFLCRLYLRQFQYQKALYCFEEILVYMPESLWVLCRYAEYANANILVAKQYFCFILQLNPNYARALWGLWRTCQNLLKQAGKKQKQNQEMTKHQELKAFCEQTLTKIYSDSGNTWKPVFEIANK